MTLQTSKLECLCLESLLSLNLACGQSQSLPKWSILQCSTPKHNNKYQNGQKNLLIKHSSLIVSKYSNREKSFIALTDIRCLYYKALRTSNLRKIDIFCNKLVAFQLSVPFTGLEKHANLKS
jgi:hypothetical protein